MDKNLCVNQVYLDVRSDKKLRVLWISPDQSGVYICWLDPKAGMPMAVPVKEMQEGFENGWIIESEDPYAARPDADAADLEHRDRIWNKMKTALLDEPGIFERKTRAEHLRRIEAETGEKQQNLYRHLSRYWERGKTPDAFLPGYHERGGRGRSRLGYSRTPKNGGGDFGKKLGPADLMYFEAAIRKYYLTKKEPDLASVYRRLLRDSYSVLETKPDSTEEAKLLPKGEVPSLRQFRYWYSKERDIREEVVKRRGETKFELTGRAATGKCDFGMMGPGSQYQVDATVGDIYLVSQFDRSDIIGRPVMYFVMDAFSRLVTGMYIGLEGPSWAGMMMALYNATTDKVDYCHQYGIEITEEMWPCHHVPAVLLGDRGELESHKADNLVSMLGIQVDNAPPYRGDLKPIIESHFRTINTQVKPLLPGWVMPDQAQRGGRDYRLDAKLDIRQFTQIIINCVIYYNTKHWLKEFEQSEQMLKAGVEVFPVKLWEWGIRNCSGALRTYPEETIRLALMPKESGSVTKNGIRFRKLYYSCPEAREQLWFENARKNGSYSVEISYDPRDMASVYVWAKDGNSAYKCSLLNWEQRFNGKSREETEYELIKQDMRRKKSERDEMEAAINLDLVIDSIVEQAEKMAPSTEGQTKAERLAKIRENREKEKQAEREEAAFTSDVGEIKRASDPSQDVLVSAGEELTPIQKMLWRDLEGRESHAGTNGNGTVS